MTVQRYSIKEALNRIYRIFRGDTLSNDAIGSLDGDVYSEDEALSRFAELVQGSLPGESFALPVGTPSTPYVHGHLIGLAVYDDASFMVSGTALIFTDNIFVVVSGTSAYIGYTGTQSSVLLEEVTFTGGTTGTSFTGISQEYRKLRIDMVARTARALTEDQIDCYFNGDYTSANYRRVRHRDSTITESDDAQVAIVAGATCPSNSFAVGSIFIPDYTNPLLNKHSYSTTVYRIDANNESYNQGAVEWENKAAITQVDLGAVANFVSGSVFRLYGEY